jgi:hypothetical protein
MLPIHQYGVPVPFHSDTLQPQEVEYQESTLVYMRGAGLSSACGCLIWNIDRYWMDGWMDGAAANGLG